MDVDPAVAAEVQEEVFAVRLGPGELGAVEQGGMLTNFSDRKSVV